MSGHMFVYEKLEKVGYKLGQIDGVSKILACGDDKSDYYLRAKALKFIFNPRENGGMISTLPAIKEVDIVRISKSAF